MWHFLRQFRHGSILNRHLFPAILTLLIILPSCNRKYNQSASIVRDCTGTYLRWRDADYYIVNDDTTDDFNNDDEVNVTFKDVTKNADKITFENESNCMLYHAIEGLVEIKRIRKK